MFRNVNIDRNGTLLCDVQEYARRHNIVYETPAKKVCDGRPLANGIMGGLVYHTDRELCMRICRTDSFDFGTADTPPMRKPYRRTLPGFLKQKRTLCRNTAFVLIYRFSRTTRGSSTSLCRRA